MRVYFLKFNFTLLTITSSISGAVIAFFYDIWSPLLGVLVAAVILDWITGIGASAIDGKLSSKTGFKGAIKKAFIFAIVALTYLADIAIDGSQDWLSTAVLFFFISNEFISILENASRAGVPIPPVLEKFIHAIIDTSKKKDDD